MRVQYCTTPRGRLMRLALFAEAERMLSPVSAPRRRLARSVSLIDLSLPASDQFIFVVTASMVCGLRMSLLTDSNPQPETSTGIQDNATEYRKSGGGDKKCYRRIDSSGQENSASVFVTGF